MLLIMPLKQPRLSTQKQHLLVPEIFWVKKIKDEKNPKQSWLMPFGLIVTTHSLILAKYNVVFTGIFCKTLFYTYCIFDSSLKTTRFLKKEVQSAW